MGNLLIDQPIITGPGQMSPEQLLIPIYRAFRNAANAQLDTLPALYDQGRIGALAYQLVDAELVAIVNICDAVLEKAGQPQPQPIS